MLRIVSAHASPPPGAQRATRWGTEEAVVGLLGAGVTDVRSVTATLTQRFAEAAALAESHDRGEGSSGVVCDWEYRMVTATRR